MLLWGVTPEIAEMEWPQGARVLAVDRSEKMISVVWPGDIEGKRKAICGDWFESPDMVECFDCVIGDGVFAFLNYPDQYKALLIRAHELLTEDGIVITRFFTRPPRPESPANVLRELCAGRIGNFHIFKFRLAMSLQSDVETGVRMGDVYNAWLEADVDRDELSSLTGWTLSEISTIDQYRDMETRRNFPSLEEFDELISEYFKRVDYCIPGYELGDCCRIVCDLREEIDMPVFTKAWAKIAQRHGVLRTRFHLSGNDTAVQEVCESIKVSLQFEDWTRFETAHRELRFQSYLESDLRSDFDPSRAPLMRLVPVVEPVRRWRGCGIRRNQGAERIGFRRHRRDGRPLYQYCSGTGPRSTQSGSALVAPVPALTVDDHACLRARAVARYSKCCGSAPGDDLFMSLLVFENNQLNMHMHRVLKNPGSREFEHWSSTNYPLTVLGYSEPELVLKIRFDRSRYAEHTIRRMLGHLKNLLQNTARGLGWPVKDQAMLSAFERRQLLCDWNRTTHSFPGAGCVHRLFEQQVERTPGALAVFHETGTLTYRELNDRANSLAHHLQSLGIGVDCLVGVCLHRSPEFIVSILVIMKSGAAYLPLDAGYPEERLTYMIADARPVAVITSGDLLSQPLDKSNRLIRLDGLQDEIGRAGHTNPDACVESNSLAYVIYTSGSKGRPKGILVPHSALTNHTQAIVAGYDVSSADRRLQFAPIGADVVISEIFPYLVTGAAIFPGPPTGFPSISVFLQFLEHHKITVVGLPSPFWHEWVTALQDERIFFPSSLRLVVSGMDQVQPDPFEVWWSRAPKSIKWFNAYGPSEATCTTTLYEADRERQGPFARVPIGRPISNVRVYLMDAHMNLAPVGIPGEIYIGGAGVARGYINQPELTSRSFISDPFSNDPKDRLYKTGDLGRFREDGNLEFLGRMDDQIKIRGYRVEPGEIEACFMKESSITRSLVICREDVPGEKRLVAYVQLRDEADADVRGWRERLRRTLPDHMVPSAFVPLDSWPLSPNGKMERSRLPALQQCEALAAAVSEEPATSTERALARIWSEVLDLDQLGIHDNFFDLGCDSISAMRVHGRISEQLGVDIQIATLMRCATIEQLARYYR